MNDSEDESEDFVFKIQALPNISVFSELMTETLGSVFTSSSSLDMKSFPSGERSNGVPIYTMGGATIRIFENVYELTPEIRKALSSTAYTGRSLKKNVIF